MDTSKPSKEPLNYCRIMNRKLIQAIGWKPYHENQDLWVPPNVTDFSETDAEKVPELYKSHDDIDRNIKSFVRGNNKYYYEDALTNLLSVQRANMDPPYAPATEAQKFEALLRAYGLGTRIAMDVKCLIMADRFGNWTQCHQPGLKGLQVGIPPAEYDGNAIQTPYEIDNTNRWYNVPNYFRDRDELLVVLRHLPMDYLGQIYSELMKHVSRTGGHGNMDFATMERVSINVFLMPTRTVADIAGRSLGLWL